MKFFPLFLLLFFPLYAPIQPESFPVVVIGGGPSGLACATACASFGYQTLLCDTEHEDAFDPNLPVTNWPGMFSSPWKPTLEALRKEFVHQGGVLKVTQVLTITPGRGEFTVGTEAGSFRAKTVVIATGKRLPFLLPKISPDRPTRILSRLWNDSFLHPNDTVAVIGTGQLASSTAIRAATRVKRVYLFYQATASSSESLIQRLPTITKMKGDQVVALNNLKDVVVVEYKHQGSKSVLRASWVVFAYDWIPNTEMVRSIVPLDASGAIVVQGGSGLTATPGLFACGEASSSGYMTAIAAAADGLNTSANVTHFLIEQGVLPHPKEMAAPEPVKEKTEPEKPSEDQQKVQEEQ